MDDKEIREEEPLVEVISESEESMLAVFDKNGIC